MLWVYCHYKFSNVYNFFQCGDRLVMSDSICPYVFSCKMFVKSVFFVYSHSEHSSDEIKKGIAFFLTL